MKKIFGILIIVGGIYLGFEGITQLQKATKSIELGSVKLSAKNADATHTAYIYIGFSALLIIGGVFVYRK